MLCSAVCRTIPGKQIYYTYQVRTYGQQIIVKCINLTIAAPGFASFNNVLDAVLSLFFFLILNACCFDYCTGHTPQQRFLFLFQLHVRVRHIHVQTLLRRAQIHEAIPN